jgi:hypothetical protein
MTHRGDASDDRRTKGARMPDRKEWMVPMTPVRDADRSSRALGLSGPTSLRAVRVTQLQQKVRSGYYATDAMMETVARMIHQSGDL